MTTPRRTALALLLLPAILVHGSGKPPAEKLLSIDTAIVHVVDSDLDGGGEFGFSSTFVNLDTFKYRIGKAAVGIGAGYNFEDYRIDNSPVFGDGWDSVHRLSLSIPVAYRTEGKWLFIASPSVSFANEGGVSFESDSARYGAVLVATYSYSPELAIGFGGGYFDGITESSGFGFIAIRWKFADDWLIANPLRPGPTGNAGLELSYQGLPGWDFGIGGAYREFAYRLDDEEYAPDGSAEVRTVPFWFRASVIPANNLFIDFYAGAAAFGEVESFDADDRKLDSADYETTPFFAINFSTRF